MTQNADSGALTEPQRTVLAEIKRLGGRASTATLRNRAIIRDWDFDPRNVVRNLAKRGLVVEHYTAITRETNWVLTEQSDSSETRCQATHEGTQCAYKPHRDNYHANGGVEWIGR